MNVRSVANEICSCPHTVSFPSGRGWLAGKGYAKTPKVKGLKKNIPRIVFAGLLKYALLGGRGSYIFANNSSVWFQRLAEHMHFERLAQHNLLFFIFIFLLVNNFGILPPGWYSVFFTVVSGKWSVLNFYKWAGVNTVFLHTFRMWALC